MIVIFTGILTSTRHCDILDTALVPFIEKIFPHGRRFQPENEPKQTSNYQKNILSHRSINWWKTPAETPGLNQIENVWGSMQYFLRHYSISQG